MRKKVCIDVESMEPRALLDLEELPPMSQLTVNPASIWIPQLGGRANKHSYFKTVNVHTKKVYGSNQELQHKNG